MRQAGILAAGALYALKHHRERLEADHIHAKMLAEGLAQIEGIEINPEEIQTNIVVFHTPTVPAHVLVEQLKEKGVAVLAVGSNSIRAVTNLMVNQEQIQQVPSLIEAAIHNQ